MSSYNAFMYDEYNPPRQLCPVQRQVMASFSVMWTMLFWLMVGFWVYFGELLIFHLLFVLGFSVIGLIFSKESPESYPAITGT